MDRKFPELCRVRTMGKFTGFEGYVIGALWRDWRWIYKVSLSENSISANMFDNWIPEEFLEKLN